MMNISAYVPFFFHSRHFWLVSHWQCRGGNERCLPWLLSIKCPSKSCHRANTHTHSTGPWNSEGNALTIDAVGNTCAFSAVTRQIFSAAVERNVRCACWMEPALVCGGPSSQLGVPQLWDFLFFFINTPVPPSSLCLRACCPGHLWTSWMCIL